MSRANIRLQMTSPSHVDRESEDLDTPVVTFSKSRVSARWQPEFGSLLEFAEAQGLMPDFSCRAGICNTCECNLISGELRYLEEPLCEPEAGRALICCSIPTSNVELDL